MEIEKILKLLSDKNRLRILNMLEKRNLCVCEITEILGIKQPSVSRHLKKLKMAGIITEKKNGFFTEYFPVKNGIWFELWKKIKEQLQEEKVIKEDEKKLKKVDRCKIKCK